MKDSLEVKRKFLIGSADPVTHKRLVSLIEAHISKSSLLSAEDGVNVQQKVDNDPPHLLLIESELSKRSGIEVVDALIKKDRELPAIIILNELPDAEHFVDEVAVGRVQFLSKTESDEHFLRAIIRGLNWIGKGAEVQFSVCFLAAGDVLIHKGEKADCVYILKRGNMEALVHEGALDVVLGEIGPQEFIGEMAYISGEPRSADVVAKTDCELIKIPIGHLDRLLFQKPAWSRALMKTLTKRIQISNQKRVSDN